jgi:L-ascorbate metabolism protein UlaG (beta-lactamase superfamily)
VTAGRRAAPSDHFDGERFFNPAAKAPRGLSAVPRMLMEHRDPWPAHIDVEPRRPLPLGDATAVVTFIGHSTFLIQTAAGHILTDPVYVERASPVQFIGPKRVRPPAVRFDDLPPIALVLLSHNHYDHCDTRTLRKLAKRFDPIVVTPIGNARLVKSAGIRRVEELDWWERANTTPFPVTVTPARHFSARTPFDRNRALWGGFAIDLADRRVYFAGDSAYTGYFHEIRSHVGAIDLALIPIGAYEPRWFMQAVHMNPAEAVQAHLDLGSPLSIAMHYGTFQLTAEGIDEPLRALDEACRAHGVPRSAFRTLEFGESFRLV